MIDLTNFSKYRGQNFFLLQNLNKWIEGIIEVENNKLCGFKNEFSIYSIQPYTSIYKSESKFRLLAIDQATSSIATEDFITERDKHFIEKFIDQFYSPKYFRNFLNPFDLSYQILFREKIPSSHSGKILIQFEILALDKNLNPKIVLQRNIRIDSLGSNQCSNPKYTILHRKSGKIIAHKIVDLGAHKVNYTKREKEIKELLAKGFSSKAIAENLCLSKETVSTHRKNIKRKEYAAAL